MVWQNRDPGADLTVIEGNEVTKRVDNPGERSRSFFDGGNWNSASREQLGIRLFARLEIPNTNKHQMKKFADLLHGLATQMEYTAANTALSEHMANMQFRNSVMMINHEMKNIAEVDLREHKNRKEVRKQNNRSDTTSS